MAQFSKISTNVQRYFHHLRLQHLSRNSLFQIIQLLQLPLRLGLRMLCNFLITQFLPPHLHLPFTIHMTPSFHMFHSIFLLLLCQSLQLISHLLCLHVYFHSPLSHHHSQLHQFPPTPWLFIVLKRILGHIGSFQPWGVQILQSLLRT